jgi:LSD1 subclass zinc finger protein
VPEIKRWGSHLPFLEELCAHWQRSHRPDPQAIVPSDEFATVFFGNYCRALGESSAGHLQHPTGYVRNNPPSERDTQLLVRSFMWLRRGEYESAARQLRRVTARSPQFAEAWIWLSAATDDLDERRTSLERALLAEPAHPLARDAWAVFSGRVDAGAAQAAAAREDVLVLADCPRCGAPLHYQPGETVVACAYCGHQIDLLPASRIEQQSTLVGELQLRRRYEAHNWEDLQRMILCQSCGSKLAMTRHLARVCPYCGSTNVLVQDSKRSYLRPDTLLPFAIDHAEARRAIRKALAQEHTLWKALTASERVGIDDLQAVYLPFWGFDGFVEARLWGWIASSDDIPKATLLDAQTMILESVLLPATDSLGSQTLKALLPYELSALAPFEASLVAGRAIALHNLDVEQALHEAMAIFTAQARERSALRPTELAAALLAAQPNDAHAVRTCRTYQPSGVSYQLLLLPVWLGRVRSSAGSRTVLVNAQSARVVLSPLQAPAGP